jgi:hypothetical protein
VIESEPKNDEIQIEIRDKIIGIIKRIAPNICCGIR